MKDDEATLANANCHAKDQSLQKSSPESATLLTFLRSHDNHDSQCLAALKEQAGVIEISLLLMSKGPCDGHDVIVMLTSPLFYSTQPYILFSLSGVPIPRELDIVVMFLLLLFVVRKISWTADHFLLEAAAQFIEPLDDGSLTGQRSQPRPASPFTSRVKKNCTRLGRSRISSVKEHLELACGDAHNKLPTVPSRGAKIDAGKSTLAGVGREDQCGVRHATQLRKLVRVTFVIGDGNYISPLDQVIIRSPVAENVGSLDGSAVYVIAIISHVGNKYQVVNVTLCPTLCCVFALFSMAFTRMPCKSTAMATTVSAGNTGGMQHESPEAMNSNVLLRHICSFAGNQDWLTFMKHPEHSVTRFRKPCLFFRKDQGLNLFFVNNWPDFFPRSVINALPCYFTCVFIQAAQRGHELFETRGISPGLTVMLQKICEQSSRDRQYEITAYLGSQLAASSTRLTVCHTHMKMNLRVNYIWKQCISAAHEGKKQFKESS
ncbi:uncharacterized protein CLUP02_17024 [Colletotrichum lupini]|uniref:Uncharacterized protein n=1 Tax=Colletotrichum lupini TaxID=145971 RepID=A0A9Q8T922_9PEZI|nr:uncharacterized protein CLUP02_17024 [Colletotrichum lupini]UQC91489.1 hypothetical protein CLUP02_17024 [Colletotrichum lupini]